MNVRGATSAAPGATGVLSEQELTMWRLFLRAHAQVTRRLEHDLVAAHDLPLATYDVLVQLAQEPEHRLRMTDLADRVLLSRSGLTRLVDRMEREGLVRRQACPSDARGMYAVLTDLGLERLREAAPAHLEGVARYVTRHFDAGELATLSDLLGRLQDAPGPLAPCAGAPD